MSLSCLSLLRSRASLQACRLQRVLRRLSKASSPWACHHQEIHGHEGTVLCVMLCPGHKVHAHVYSTVYNTVYSIQYRGVENVPHWVMAQESTAHVTPDYLVAGNVQPSNVLAGCRMQCRQAVSCHLAWRRGLVTLRCAAFTEMSTPTAPCKYSPVRQPSLSLGRSNQA